MDDLAFTIVFLDGETRRVQGATFAVACVKAAYQRLQDGAKTYAELGVDEKACRKEPPVFPSNMDAPEYIDPYEKSRRSHRENY